MAVSAPTCHRRREDSRSRTARPVPAPYGCPGELVVRERSSRSLVTNAIQECVDKLHIREVLTYQPINRYWPFQIYETAIFIGLALVLAGFCFWWVRRRLS